MREDIVAGLKNAVERGESVEKAVAAFINAGYNQDEVQEAAKSLGFLHPKQEQIPQPKLAPVPVPVQQIQQKPQFKPLPKSPSLNKEIPIPNVPLLPQVQESIPDAPIDSNDPEKQEVKGKFKILNVILGIISLILLIVVGIFAWNFLTKNWILG